MMNDSSRKEEGCPREKSPSAEMAESMKTIDVHNHSYEVPVRRILNIFDLNPFYFSEGYQLLLEFLHELNDSVLNIKTCDDVHVSENAMKVIDMLDKMMASRLKCNLKQ
ncbi:hypothetical protein OESDEN_08363 [Oesophagostomum dentatum]|uniref:Uncharacterized protein n=1 Tax=Oesophagostomum dentatum TaxID=61180 RepID=A0A0B1T3E9_OESDE|nr:hypothetical protein OESDEN_08363 [Oesophagostomum dentatum]